LQRELLRNDLIHLQLAALQVEERAVEAVDLGKRALDRELALEDLLRAPVDPGSFGIDAVDNHLAALPNILKCFFTQARHTGRFHDTIEAPWMAPEKPVTVH
jgi:hypothetical protein